MPSGPYIYITTTITMPRLSQDQVKEVQRAFAKMREAFAHMSWSAREMSQRLEAMRDASRKPSWRGWATARLTRAEVCRMFALPPERLARSEENREPPWHNFDFSWEPFAATIDPHADSPDDTLLPLDAWNAKVDAMLAEWEAEQQKEGMP